MLSKRKKEVLQAIISYISMNEIAPTVRELCDMLGVSSSSTVQRHLEQLQELGYITKHPTKPRTIRVIKYESTIPNDLVSLF